VSRGGKKTRVKGHRPKETKENEEKEKKRKRKRKKKKKRKKETLNSREWKKFRMCLVLAAYETSLFLVSFFFTSVIAKYL
jgi:hypothetical protein